MGGTANNLQGVERRIRAAVEAAQRGSNGGFDAVELIAVSKTFPAARVREAIAAGQRAFGESYLQEAVAKIAEIGTRADDGDAIAWHFIGPIQSNKTRAIAARFDWVHSVDRLKVAERLSEQRDDARGPLQVLIEVNVDGEATKSGVSPDALGPLADAIARLPRLALRGLMAVPKPRADEAGQRAAFARVRALRDGLVARGHRCDQLSMGMSDDLEAAIAEGATMVRVGSAIFGTRTRHRGSGMKIGFVGGGNMAQALMGGLVAKRSDARFVVVEPHADTRAIVARIAPGAALHDVASADLAGCDAVVIAVKPQQFREAATTAARWLEHPLVVSIAAGVRMREIAHWLGADRATGAASRRIVRAMPNTPALIGEGIAGLFATPAVDAAGRTLAESLLGAVGQVLWVADEAKLDAVTAVSGSGPGYVFALIEALERAANELGFDAVDARRLAVTTFCGASRLASASEEPIAVLRERVTSKGGTTQAGLDVLRERGCANAMVAAVEAAAKRSIELGDEMARDGRLDG